MRLLFILLVTALLSAVYGVEILKPGTTINLRCPIKTDENSFIQIIKENIRIDRTGSVSVFTGPYVIANNTDLDPSLLNMTSRYSMSYSSVHGYILTISDARPEDSGKWECRETGKLGAVFTVSMSESVVAGPIQKVLWRQSETSFDPSIGEEPTDVIPEGGYVTVNASTGRVDISGPVPQIFCEVVCSNVEPNVNMTIGNSSDPDHTDVTHRFLGTSVGFATLGNGGLGWYMQTTSFRPSVWLKFDPDDNGKELHCRAAIQLPTPDIVESYVILNIQYAPMDVTCTSSYPRAPLGYQNATVTCRVRGNPPPDVSWSLVSKAVVTPGTPVDGYSVQNSIEGDRVTTTLNIETVKDEDYGDLTVIARNMFRERSFKVTLSEGPIGGAAVVRVSVSWLIFSALIGAVIMRL